MKRPIEAVIEEVITEPSKVQPIIGIKHTFIKKQRLSRLVFCTFINKIMY